MAASAWSTRAPSGSSRQRPVADDAAVVLEVLNAIDRGERPTPILIRSAEFDRTFSRAAAGWLNAAPAAIRSRREQVAVAALLFVAERALEGPSRQRFKLLVEQQCALMRQRNRTEFDRRWLLTSLAYAESSGDRLFLRGTVQSLPVLRGPAPACDAFRDCDHLSHVRSTFADESIVRLIDLDGQGRLTIAARQPGELAGLMARARLQTASVSSRARATDMARLEAGLQSLLTDPTVGTDARLRLGLFRYALNQRRESLDELAHVIATSRHAEERAIAHYVSALIHDANIQADAAIRSFEEALVVMPHIRSVALTLATRYHLAGRVDDASALLDRTFAAEPPAFDPWRGRYAVWTWYQAFDRLLESFK